MKNHIDLEPVESSRIVAIGYEPDTQMLAIQFKPTKKENAPTYLYDGVEPQTWEAFRNAESIGTFFGKVINKPDVYRCTKCDDKEIVILAQGKVDVVESELVPSVPSKPGDEVGKQMIAAAQKVASSLGITVIRSPFEYERADQFVKKVKATWKQVEDHRVYLKEDILKAGRKLDALYKPILDLLAKAEKDAKQLQIAYELEQKRIADESRKQAEAEANRQREAIEATVRAEREAADRLAAELRQKAEAERKKGNEAKANVLTGQARTVVLESEEKAVETLEVAAQIVARPVATEIPIIQGNSTRTIWRGRVVDATKVPDMFKVVSDPLIQDYAKRTKGANPVPGVEFYPEYSKASRSE